VKAFSGVLKVRVPRAFVPVLLSWAAGIVFFGCELSYVA
jgi:hypothetical protein